MNLDPTAVLPPNDIRNPAGSGPSWYIQDSGQLNPDVVQAASLCDRGRVVAEGDGERS